MALLVHHGIFKTVELYFLMVGHTHCDIDRVFSYYAKSFKKHGNHTLDQMRYNIVHSYEEKTDKNMNLSTEMNDENWAIEYWMRRHMLGLKYLGDYHGFQIAFFPELPDQVGLKYRIWNEDDWSVDVKPLFNTIPTGRPHMELPNYAHIVEKYIRGNVEKMHGRGGLTSEHMATWEETWKYINNKRQLWQDRRKNFLIKREGPVEKVQLVACDWKEWPLDTLRRLRGQQPVEEELDMRTADEIEVGWNPKHTILNQFKSKFPEPIINRDEEKSTEHVNHILESHVKPGIYVIVQPDVEVALQWKWRPADNPWIAKVLTKLDEEKNFKCYWILPVSHYTNLKSKVYKLNAAEPRNDMAVVEHFTSIMQQFTKSNGFNKSNRLKRPIIQKYTVEVDVETQLYDDYMAEND